MPLVLKDGADTADLPTIVLAGESIYVPRATLRHCIALVEQTPKVNATLRKLGDMQRGIAAGEPADGFPSLVEADFIPVLALLQRALLPLYPTLTVDDLLDLDIGIMELVAVVPLIFQQASSRRRPAGEPEAAGSLMSPTGESSPPISS